MYSDEDQEKFLEEAIAVIKNQSLEIGKCIEIMNTRQCLKEVSVMLYELKSSALSPRRYYSLYSEMFNQMLIVESFFKDDFKRGRDLFDLYDSVQQAHSLIPRLYLVITAGAVLLESKQGNPKHILNELLQMVKGVQNPVRGLFLRYYLLQMIKEKLPDEGNEFSGEQGNVEDTIRFILQNLEEMNRLWIRLSMGSAGSEKYQKEKERGELKVLVGENIVRLSNLKGLTLTIYKEEVLPKILEILLESRDSLSQHYLMECIIYAFPNDYNIKSMGIILDSCTKLLSTVDIKSIFINLMDKLAKIASEIEQGEIHEYNLESQNIFELLSKNIDKIIEENSNYEHVKLLELLVAYMKFTIKCNPKIIDFVNHILSSASNIIIKDTDGFHRNEVSKLIVRLLSIPLESVSLEILKMDKYPVLMKHLDYSNRKTLALRILQSLTKSNQKLTTNEEVSILFEFTDSLLKDPNEKDDEVSNNADIEFEQQSLAKTVHLVKNKDFSILILMYEQFKNAFSKGGEKRMKYTIPALVSATLILINKLSIGHWLKSGNTLEGKAKENVDNYLDLEANFINDEEFILIINKLLKKIQENIKSISFTYPQIAFRLLISTIHTVDNILIQKENFEEITRSLFENAFVLFSTEFSDQDQKLAGLYEMVGCLNKITVFQKENYLSFAENLLSNVNKIIKRHDQCMGMMAVSDLFWNHQLNDLQKLKDCLQKARKFAEYAMSNPQNLELFILLLNKYKYFTEKKVEGLVTPEYLSELVESIRNHVETIKNESKDQDFLEPIEKYFVATIEIFKKKSNEEFYKDLKI